MKKRLVTLCMAMLLVFTCSIGVMARGYVCDTCGSTTGVYPNGCKGTLYDIMYNQLCATHNTRDLTLYFYDSYMYCLDCDASCTADGAAHLHEMYDATTNEEIIICQWY